MRVYRKKIKKKKNENRKSSAPLLDLPYLYAPSRKNIKRTIYQIL